MNSNRVGSFSGIKIMGIWSIIVLCIGAIVTIILAILLQNIHIGIGIISGLIFTLLLFIVERSIEIINNFNNVFSFLDEHNNNLISNNSKTNVLLRSLGSKVDTEFIQKLPRSPQKKFMDFLITETSKNKHIFDSMFEGEFKFSSDVFQDLYIKLLMDDSVDSYYSCAIVNSKDYFKKNKISTLRRQYVDIAKRKPVEILFFIDDTLHQDHIRLIEQEYELLKRDVENCNSSQNNGVNPILLLKGYLSWLTERDKDLVRDYGIAGNTACAEMITKQGVERYSLFFNIDMYGKFEKRFNKQKEIIKTENITLQN